jgi:hypothetical protein
VSATQIFLIAIVAGVIGRWANNQKAVPDAKQVIAVVFSLILISAADQGGTQQIARGFALLFLVAVLLSSNSPLTGLAKSSGAGTSAPKTTPPTIGKNGYQS